MERGETKGRTAQNGQGNGELAAGLRFGDAESRTVGWQPGCDHGLEPIPCTVLDPFGGACTTGLVADRLQRNAIMIELNPAYVEMARARILGDAPLLAEVER